MKVFTRVILSIVILVATIYLFKEVLFAENESIVIKENKEIAMYILGVLSALLGQVFSFYFGSSEAQEKT